ncbi:hypothetical protein prwr041_24400 [Prevotella herbatica]|uniref:Uncharacterized protein n=1 Tax=Prevotella herbatica TaxID=2801997 RepID=A0ABM8HW77_9BACT|nr:hypothetical protein prwr041_24400 [Prevotella herbatica]
MYSPTISKDAFVLRNDRMAYSVPLPAKHAKEKAMPNFNNDISPFKQFNISFIDGKLLKRRPVARQHNKYMKSADKTNEGTMAFAPKV